MTTSNPEDSADRQIVITRRFHAPRPLVYQAWVDPKAIVQWWGPRGFTTTTHERQVVPGGVWRFIMHGPDGVDYPNRIYYIEVTKDERLVYEHGSDDPDDPARFHVTVTFTGDADETTVELKTRFATREERDRTIEFGAVQGGNQTLERLEEHIARVENGDGIFVLSRTFDAPRELLFKVCTEAEHLSHWWGPKGFEVEVCQLELKPGGIFHYSMKTREGYTMWGKFVFREVTPPSRLVFINSFSDEQGNTVPAPMIDDWALETLSTITFEEEAKNRTKVTVETAPMGATAAQRKLFRENHPSMQGGWGGSLDKLTSYLATQLK